MQQLRIFIIAVTVFELAPLAHGQQLIIVDDRAGFFEDISATTPLVLGNDQEIVLTTTIGNVVFAPGGVVVADNGGVAFRDPPK